MKYKIPSNTRSNKRNTKRRHNREELDLKELLFRY